MLVVHNIGKFSVIDILIHSSCFRQKGIYLRGLNASRMFRWAEAMESRVSFQEAPKSPPPHQPRLMRKLLAQS